MSETLKSRKERIEGRKKRKKVTRGRTIEREEGRKKEMK